MVFLKKIWSKYKNEAQIENHPFFARMLICTLLQETLNETNFQKVNQVK